MSYVNTELKRSTLEKTFIIFFLPTIFIGYLLLKWDHMFVKWGLLKNVETLYFFNKSPTFWYITLYTFLVCYFSGKVLWTGKSPYKKGKNPVLSMYQKSKFSSIFLVQFILLYLLPFYILPLSMGQDILQDQVKPPKLDAYVYVSKAFTSWGGMIYTFVLVPISVYLFGKRYCSWFCACGNLAEAIGITKWGASWVKHKTPTGHKANKWEHLQTFFMIMGFFYGLILFLDFLKLYTAQGLLEGLKTYQDIAVDLVFGALIGIGAYPFFGTRIWCRYGCPLAKMMELQGRYLGSKFAVKANDKCKGLDLCSQTCPMGIDVASYAHLDKKPILGSFGLKESSCIGCGGCIDACPVKALEFEKIWK